MTEITYRTESNGIIVEHKAILRTESIHDVILGTMHILRAEWQEEAIEKALRDYLE